VVNTAASCIAAVCGLVMCAIFVGIPAQAVCKVLDMAVRCSAVLTLLVDEQPSMQSAMPCYAVAALHCGRSLTM
jgi:hypothetical protein